MNLGTVFSIEHSIMLLKLDYPSMTLLGGWSEEKFTIRFSEL